MNGHLFVLRWSHQRTMLGSTCLKHLQRFSGSMPPYLGSAMNAEHRVRAHVVTILPSRGFLLKIHIQFPRANQKGLPSTRCTQRFHIYAQWRYSYWCWVVKRWTALTRSTVSVLHVQTIVSTASHTWEKVTNTPRKASDCSDTACTPGADPGCNRWDYLCVRGAINVYACL